MKVGGGLFDGLVLGNVIDDVFIQFLGLRVQLHDILLDLSHLIIEVLLFLVDLFSLGFGRLERLGQ